MRELVLSVDYSQKWPLSDIKWFEEDQPDWDSLITPELKKDLIDWAKFFNTHADWETGSFGGEGNRSWFEKEGHRLLAELRDQAGDRYQFRLNFWF